ncbi:MAG: cytochrome c [Sulfurimonas sp.]|uniref:c-type cytochrome n=1 Tax=Sulfurimonas sp. TaxID=2022749 RepID=UPI00262AF61D|nr:c-type cytochrome [Sulfurimonas sp.]MDD5401309.1 cytochrome c [Sulfurimonas sp.]
MRDVLLLLLPISLFAQASFITPMEYASSLYKNPRGIGCQNCHGVFGEGRVVARYEHKNEKKSFSGPEINSMNFNDFFTALNVRKNGMPRYFLTQKEIQALYFYVQEKKKENTPNAK